jgi:4-amino-4-deoxy-L-arabinose transferase-like glycosyltransferase
MDGNGMADLPFCQGTPWKGPVSTHPEVCRHSGPRTLAAFLSFWWTRALFAGAASRNEVRPASLSRVLLSLLLLSVLAGLLFLTRLSAPLLEPQEPRYAEIPRQMLARGDWLMPILHGRPYLDKPPLLYWFVMASYRLCGVHDWAARLVPGLAGILIVLVTYLWGRRALNEQAAWCGALALCLSVRFVYLQRILTFDGLLALWVTTALAAGQTALASSRLRVGWWLISALACGLGILTKGPVALVLVLAPLLAFCLLDRRCPPLGWTVFPGYLAIVAGVAGPWFIVIARREPDFLGDFLWRHHIVRFVEPFDHQEPFWFFLPALLLGMLPWTLLLPGFVRFLIRRSPRPALDRPAPLGFLLLAGLGGLVFFSASGCKRPVYILPVMPPLALARGYYLDIASRQYSAGLRTTSLLATGATWLVLAAALGAAIWGACLWLPGSTALVLVGLCLAGTALLVRIRTVSWVSCAVVTFAVLFTAVQFLLPAYNEQFALRQPLEASGERMTVICYPQRFDSVSFYRPDADVQVFAAAQLPQLLRCLADRPGALVVVKSGPAADALRHALPESVEFVRCGGGAVEVGWVRSRTVVARTAEEEGDRGRVAAPMD